MYIPSGLIGPDLVSVQPMNSPKMNLMYFDYVYIDKLKERRLKIEKIKEQIKNKNGNTDDHTTGILGYYDCN